jgi:hypothetical protein
MEDMAADFGWDLFDEEEGFNVPLTSEEVAAQERLAREEAIGELYASQWAFD